MRPAKSSSPVVALIGVCFFLSFSSHAQVRGGEISKSIFFGGGSYYMDDEQATMLSRWLDSIPNLLEKYEIQLISHTDNIGGKRFNEWLSRMRSQTVHGLLIQKDIPERMIHTRDWGMENPVYENDSYQGVIMNRRVDVVLHPVVF
jgi:outer membrane protein OmpA-like peptidoglycan-associated protein